MKLTPTVKNIIYDLALEGFSVKCIQRILSEYGLKIRKKIIYNALTTKRIHLKAWRDGRTTEARLAIDRILRH